MQPNSPAPLPTPTPRPACGAGQQRIRDPVRLATEFDLVSLCYAVLCSAVLHCMLRGVQVVGRSSPALACVPSPPVARQPACLILY